MEWVEVLDKGFSGATGFLKLILEAISTLCIFLGLVATARLALVRYRQGHPPSLMFMKARLLFGSWLALALEFQLGADVIGTSIAPSFNQLIQLGAITKEAYIYVDCIDKEYKGPWNQIHNTARVYTSDDKRNMDVSRGAARKLSVIKIRSLKLWKTYSVVFGKI